MIKEIDKPKEPPQIAIKFANMVFLLGIVFALLLKKEDRTSGHGLELPNKSQEA